MNVIILTMPPTVYELINDVGMTGLSPSKDDIKNLLLSILKRDKSETLKDEYKDIEVYFKEAFNAINSSGDKVLEALHRFEDLKVLHFDINVILVKEKG